MKITAAAIAVSALALGAAAQQAKPDIDVTILNYALTLEHLESAFYSGVLKKFNEKAFRNAGYPKWVYQRVQVLASQEKTHVAFLSGALGAAATKPCKYSFPYKTVGEALALSRVLESVGVSAYLGAADDITNADYLTAAGAILTVEARHQAVVAEVNGGSGYPSAFDTPLGFSQVYSLAAPFIKSCPDTNPALPVVKFNDLAVGKPNKKHQVQLTFECDKGQTILYAHFLNGLNDVVVKINPDHTVAFPKNLSGVVYVVVSTSQESLEDSNTVAGPGYVQLPDHIAPSFVPSKQRH